MHTPHLSRLCRDGDIEGIISFLKSKADVPAFSLCTSASNNHANDTTTGNNNDNNNTNVINNDGSSNESNNVKGANEETVNTNKKVLDIPMAEHMNGIWGYRDPDGRTVFHWAIAVENYKLAETLMSDPYNVSVLSEDNSHTTPFMTACTLGAPLPFLETLLNKSVDAYNALMEEIAMHDELPSHLEAYTNALKVQHDQENEQQEQKQHSPLEPEEQEQLQEQLQKRECDEGNIREEENASKDVRCTSSTTVNISNQEARQRIVNWEDDLGNTSLFLAVRKGDKDIIHFLLKNGASLMHQNRRGQSVLHRAVMSAKLHVVEELVLYSEKLHATNKKRHREWMNLQDKHGDSALFYASSDENEDIGVYLLRHGADRHLRNKEGKEFWEVEGEFQNFHTISL